MKNFVTLMIVLVFAFTFTKVKGQDLHEFNDPNQQTIVHKEFDENGNLIAFDSTFIHKWSNDTSVTFNFDDQLNFDHGFPDMNKIMEEFFSDTIHQNFVFPEDFAHSPFDHEDFFREMIPEFSDSTWLNNFFNIDSLQNFQQQFIFPDLNQIREHFKNFDNPLKPNFKSLNENQKKELKELQEKHRKEMEELQRKWERIK